MPYEIVRVGFRLGFRYFTHREIDLSKKLKGQPRQVSVPWDIPVGAVGVAVRRPGFALRLPSPDESVLASADD
jgi:hypothetical protein